MTFSTIPDTSSGHNMDLHRDASRDGAVPPLAPQPCPRLPRTTSGEPEAFESGHRDAHASRGLGSMAAP